MKGSLEEQMSTALAKIYYILNSIQKTKQKKLKPIQQKPHNPNQTYCINVANTP